MAKAAVGGEGEEEDGSPIEIPPTQIPLSPYDKRTKMKSQNLTKVSVVAQQGDKKITRTSNNNSAPQNLQDPLKALFGNRINNRNSK